MNLDNCRIGSSSPTTMELNEYEDFQRVSTLFSFDAVRNCSISSFTSNKITKKCHIEFVPTKLG